MSCLPVGHGPRGRGKNITAEAVRCGTVQHALARLPGKVGPEHGQRPVAQSSQSLLSMRPHAGGSFDRGDLGRRVRFRGQRRSTPP